MPLKWEKGLKRVNLELHWKQERGISGWGCPCCNIWEPHIWDERIWKLRVNCRADIRVTKGCLFNISMEKTKARGMDINKYQKVFVLCHQVKCVGCPVAVQLLHAQTLQVKPTSRYAPLRDMELAVKLLTEGGKTAPRGWKVYIWKLVHQS